MNKQLLNQLLAQRHGLGMYGGTDDDMILRGIVGNGARHRRRRVVHKPKISMAMLKELTGHKPRKRRPSTHNRKVAAYMRKYGGTLGEASSAVASGGCGDCDDDYEGMGYEGDGRRRRRRRRTRRGGAEGDEDVKIEGPLIDPELITTLGKAIGQRAAEKIAIQILEKKRRKGPPVDKTYCDKDALQYRINRARSAKEAANFKKECLKLTKSDEYERYLPYKELQARKKINKMYQALNR